MTAQYFTVLTNYGTQAFAKALATNQPLRLSRFAVGDGNGQAVTPTADRTALVKETHRANVSAVSLDPRNNKQIIIELTIPEDVGGFYIREMGVFDSANKLVAYANAPESFKPTLESGSGKVQVLRMILKVSNSQAVTLSIDNSVIFVTRQQLNPQKITSSTTNGFDESGHTHEIEKADTTKAGIVQLTDDTGLDSNKLGLSARAGKKLAQLISTVQLALGNYIPNSKKSNSVTSNSNDNVATSSAVKTAYDKGVEAKTAADNAQRTANDGVSKANAALTSANQANSAAYNAQRTANDGVSKANAAQTSANQANSAAYNAQLTANDGVSKANAAQTSANQAKSAADNAQKTADDGVNKANAAQTSANQAKSAADNANNNANNRVPKTGNTTINGALRAKNPSGGWSAFQFEALSGYWQLEAHPNPTTDDNRRFNMIYIPDKGDNVYLSFPHIRNNGDTVAYRSWVEDRTTPWSKIDGKPAFATRWPNAAEQGYSHSLGQTGWTKLPSGLIIQWGEVDGIGVHKFPIAFNSVGQVFVCERSYSDDGEIIVVRDVNNTSFRAWSRRDMGSFLFFAIGS
nr:MAG TPA: tail collar fiber protein [Caudoviricetes sp.]